VITFSRAWGLDGFYKKKIPQSSLSGCFKRAPMIVHVGTVKTPIFYFVKDQSDSKDIFCIETLNHPE